MILADNDIDRAVALAKLIEFQIQDFCDILRVMPGKPITIRLLDPPLHEFLPSEPSEISDLAALLNIPVEKVHARSLALREVNPMLGHRGCRLGITTPDVTKMQATAIFEAIHQMYLEDINVEVEIMIPLVGSMSELKNQRYIIESIAREKMLITGVALDVKIGTMIEIPRAALTAEHITTEADFFSFGTNDLTQVRETVENIYLNLIC
jgi:pyruvate,orthophosphate dikinase